MAEELVSARGRSPVTAAVVAETLSGLPLARGTAGETLGGAFLSQSWVCPGYGAPFQLRGALPGTLLLESRRPSMVLGGRVNELAPKDQEENGQDGRGDSPFPTQAQVVPTRPTYPIC